METDPDSRQEIISCELFYIFSSLKTAQLDLTKMKSVFTGVLF